MPHALGKTIADRVGTALARLCTIRRDEPSRASRTSARPIAGVPALRSASLVDRRRRDPRPDGRERRGQVDAHQDSGRRGRAPTTATIAIDGAPGSPSTARMPPSQHGLRFIHQELNVVPTLSVAENIFLGRAYPQASSACSSTGTGSDARGGGRRSPALGISHIDPRRKMARLSVGDQMLVRIAAAFLDERGRAPARVYVMDEPTAALTRRGGGAPVRRDRARSAGRAVRVLYVSHRLDEVMRHLRPGHRSPRRRRRRNAGRSPRPRHDEIIRMMIGRQVSEAYPARAPAPAARTRSRSTVRDLARQQVSSGSASS